MLFFRKSKYLRLIEYLEAYADREHALAMKNYNECNYIRGGNHNAVSDALRAILKTVQEGNI